MKSNIVLIGMPGAGKSTLGVVLAKIANRGFVDVDLVIQQRNGATLQALIDRLGTERFIELEGEALRGIDAERSVIATGGSAVYSRGAIEQLRENGVIVYLEIGYESLAKRLGDLHERGVVMRTAESNAAASNKAAKGSAEADSHEADDELAIGKATGSDAASADSAKANLLRVLYDERRPLYEAAADITVNVDGLSITDAAQKVIAAIG